MKKFPSAALALFATTALLVSAWAGCGSDEAPGLTADGGSDQASPDGVANPPDGDATGDGSAGDSDIGDSSFVDAITDGSRGDAATCVANGTTCANSTECCSANCTTLGGVGSAKVCGNPINCKVAGVACTTGNECCLGSCVNKACGAKACVADNGSCGAASDCCSGQCVPNGTGGGICQALNCAPAPCTPSCKTSGNPCGKDGDCCGGFCNGGICSSRGSFCTQTGDVCSTDFECCGGACTKAPGAALGLCGLTSAPGVPGCTPSGALCGASAGTDGGTVCDQSCCSRSCGPFGANGGLEVCEPPSGCKPTGEVCRTDSDCCGWSGAPPPVNGAVTCAKSSPTQEFGRCDNGGACREPGSICKVGGFASCSAENNCCEPHFADGGAVDSSYCNNDPANCCRQDSLGIPRCLMVASNCATNPPPAGTTCATSADCCGKPCVNNKCDATCVSQGGGCTTTADCCPGIACSIPEGSTHGICGGTVLADGGVTDAAADTGTGGGDGGDGGTGGNLPDGGTCSLYGQVCTGAGNCCNGVPCISGTCHFP